MMVVVRWWTTTDSSPPRAADPAPCSPAPNPAPTAQCTSTSAAVPVSSPSVAHRLTPGLAVAWLLGMLVLSLCVAIQVLRFGVKLRGAVEIPGDAAALLNDCRREFGVSRRIELLETDAVRSPALFGLFRLRLLLPRGLASRFSRSELRYIFLHELAHVKRGDLWLN